MAIKRRDFQKLSSTVQEFLLKLPDEEESARLRDNLLHALHFLQLYYRILQNRDKNNDPLQWNIDHSLSPLTPFKEAPDKFDWEWVNIDSQKIRQSLPKTSIENFKVLPQIINAIKDGDFDSIRQIVKKEPKSVNSSDALSRDCIMYAIQFDQIEILKFLIKNGANLNNIAADASTSLHRAVYKSNPEIIQLLLDHKANINTQDNYNRSPLHWSVVNKEVDALKMLIKYNPVLNVKDKDGMTPCMWACHLDHIEHFKLLSKIDNINKKFSNLNKDDLEVDNDGRTWMHWSVRKNEPFKCLNFLLNSESALIRDKEGKTCLHAASEQGALQACKIIIDTIGSKIVNERDNKKQTPLHLATLNGHARTIKILIDNGADPNLRDSTGASSIDYVTKRNLFFCNSIIEICLRNLERKNRQNGVSSSNSVASSLNGSESNLTPAPPTTPKNTFTRSFQSHQLKEISGKPPRPININNTLSFSTGESSNFNNQNGSELSKTAPANLTMISTTNSSSQILIPPSPPTGAKTRPNHRGGWNSVERIMSGSLRLSRASTRTSLASDDLDKYMNNENFGGSLNNIENINPSLQNSFMNDKPLPQPRVSSTASANNQRIMSGRSHDTPMSTASYEAPSMIPPPIKPRKSSSVTSLNTSNIDIQSNHNKLNTFHSNENNHHQANFVNNTNNATFIKPNINHTRNSNGNLNVEDISGDEVSLTSVKGEGCASDLSDNEIRNQSHYLNQRSKIKKSILNSEQNPKRPTTPMDIRILDPNQNQKQIRPNQNIQQHPQAQSNDSGYRGMAIRNQHMGDQHQVSNRFNEWDPYGANKLQQQQQMQQNINVNHNDRQKSPLKSKQQITQQQSSNFAHTFLNTDSSPRQSSGRSQLGSANTTNQKVPMQQQQQQQFNINSNQDNSSTNLDLMVSGQKLGSRKDLSPTNTPRDLNQIQHNFQHQQSIQQQKPFNRRLQPLDKLAPEPVFNNYNSNNNPIVNEGQFAKQKKNAIERKKLEPIKGLNALTTLISNSQTHVESYSTGHSLTENDAGGSGSGTLTNHNINEDELSVSENTLSSEKQILSSLRTSRKKKSSFNQNRSKKLIEPVGNDANEALKM